MAHTSRTCTKKGISVELDIGDDVLGAVATAVASNIKELKDAILFQRRDSANRYRYECLLDQASRDGTVDMRDGLNRTHDMVLALQQQYAGLDERLRLLERELRRKRKR